MDNIFPRWSFKTQIKRCVDIKGIMGYGDSIEKWH